MNRRIETDLLRGLPDDSPAMIFSAVHGVQVRADTVKPHDQYGRTVSHVGPVTIDMFQAVELWVADVQRIADRAIDALVLCSVWRPYSPGRPARHSEGLAMDIGGVWWSRDDALTAYGYGDNRRDAVALEATMRLSFGTVLGPIANLDHADHWHVDIGKPAALTKSELARSARGQRMVEVVWIQEACSIVHNKALKRDGIWGPHTAAAVTAVLDEYHYGAMPDITRPAVYEAFCLITAHMGFYQKAAT